MYLFQWAYNDLATQHIEEFYIKHQREDIKEGEGSDWRVYLTPSIGENINHDTTVKLLSVIMENPKRHMSYGFRYTSNEITFYGFLKDSY